LQCRSNAKKTEFVLIPPLNSRGVITFFDGVLWNLATVVTK
jgi:hypothetical protein